jgi:hypothetical protein
MKLSTHDTMATDDELLEAVEFLCKRLETNPTNEKRDEETVFVASGTLDEMEQAGGFTQLNPEALRANPRKYQHLSRLTIILTLRRPGQRWELEICGLYWRFRYAIHGRPQLAKGGARTSWCWICDFIVT